MLSTLDTTAQRNLVQRLTLEGELFGGCRQNQVRSVMAAGELNHYPAGEYLFRVGDEADAVYAVLDGEVEILLPKGDHEEVIATIRAGEVFGAVAVATEGHRAASAAAKTDADILAIHEKDIPWLMQSYTAVAFKIMISLIRTMSRRMLSERQRHAPA